MVFTGLITILIKSFANLNYNPSEDIIEGGVAELLSLAKKYRASIKVLLEKENFTDDQIRTVKKILAESYERFILNSPATIYDNNADAMQISRKIFSGFIGQQATSVASSDIVVETEKEKIIKGISLVVQKTLDLCLSSPDYTGFLTKNQKEINKKIIVHDEQLIAYEKRIVNLEQTNKERAVGIAEKIEEYYDYVLKLYKRRNIGNSLLGEESLSELYMQLFYHKSKEEIGDIEQLLEEFSSVGEHGVLWIVGEPGHGKTSMCIKAVVDYANRERYHSVRGVFWFRLNPQSIIKMIEDSTMTLRLAFSWGMLEGERNKLIDPAMIEGSLVFLDGFDELKPSLEKCNISDNQFYSQVNQIAEAYHLFIVVTSRKQALEQGDFHLDENLRNGTGKISCRNRDGSSQENYVKLLDSLNKEQQTEWLERLISFRKGRNEDITKLEKYRQPFHCMQKNKDVSGLLAVPILLRMIVQNCFRPTSDNRVELYHALFDMTLRRQGLEGRSEQLHSIYCKIAFAIFINDDYCAEIEKQEISELAGSTVYLYQYYLQTVQMETNTKESYFITFFHRTFYQYFLSEFIYEKLKAVKDEDSGELFLKYLWPRQVDSYVLENLRYKAKNNHIGYSWILGAIDKTDCILTDYEQFIYKGKESIGRFDKANNTFWNAVSICNYVFQNEKDSKKMIITKRVAELLSRYDCFGIHLRDASLSTMDLSNANLGNADLRNTDLSNANLDGADLRYSDLREANLSNAYLTEADLREVDLRNADCKRANLEQVNLSSADLRESDFSGANMRYSTLYASDFSNAKLISTRMREADLREATLDSSNLSGSDLSNADLNKTNLSNANLSSAKLRWVKLTNTNLDNVDLSSADLEYTNAQNADLSSINLRFAKLNFADLRFCNLKSADLRSADLCCADLSDAILKNANLNAANLDSSDLSFADLSFSDLSSIDLTSSILKFTDLRYANLSFASLKDTYLIGAKLSGVIMQDSDLENAHVTRDQYNKLGKR